MKKRIGLFAVCVGLMMNVLPVQADLIWEPEEDSFYTEHADECVYVNRTYVANGPDGQVTVYESPESQKIVDVWEKGKSVSISFLYEDESGVTWGIYDNGNTSESGWVQLEQMARRYDSNAFREEYQDQFIEETVAVYGDQENIIYFWKYPGAGKYTEISMDEEGMELQQTFVDEEGHKWAYVGYYRGMKQYWVCVDCPTAELEELYPNGTPQRGVLLAGTDIAVVEDKQPAPENGQAAEKDEQNDETEIVEEENGATKEVNETNEEEETENDRPVKDTENKQVSFVAVIIAGVMALTGAMLAILKKSFGTKK